MATRHECSCGHTKGQHSSSSVRDEKATYKWCRVPGCKCKKYNFLKFVVVGIYNSIDKQKGITKKIYRMYDLGPDGKAPGFNDNR